MPECIIDHRLRCYAKFSIHTDAYGNPNRDGDKPAYGNTRTHIDAHANRNSQTHPNSKTNTHGQTHQYTNPRTRCNDNFHFGERMDSV